VSNPLLLVIGAGGALCLFALAVRRPAPACALLALVIPLSAGMARGAVVPLLRVNEALLLVVAAGLLVHLVRGRRPLAYWRLDIAVVGFCLLNVIIPWAVILLSNADAALDDWLVVLAPVQYAAVYLVYSRAELQEADLRLFFNACMLASLPVAAIAAMEALDLGGVRDLVATWYPTAPQPSWDPVYRPASLLGHYSAVGAFGLLNLVLALALAASGQRGYPRWWLALVMAANLVSLVASDTYAPLAMVPVGVIAAVLVVRRVPWWTLVAALPVMAAAAVALWPSVSVRIGTQFSGAGGGGLPESMQTRIDYWQAFFVPALLHNGPWLGTGTLIPDEVPRSLVNFVDNGYLWQLYRAGVPGLAALFVVLGAVAAVAWWTRTSDDPSRRVLGAVCLGAVASVAALDLTSEYLTFTAVSQEFWMLVGLLSGTVLAARTRAAAEALPRLRRVVATAPGHLGTAPAARIASVAALPRDGVATAPGHLGTAPAARIASAAALARDGKETVHVNGASPAGLRALVHASAAVLAGFGVARVFGFLFQVVAGRALSTDGYGRLTYALAVANIAAVLLTTAPLGLSRFLSRSAGRRSEQEAYSVNWLAVIGILLGVSALATAVFAGPAGLGGWMLAGLLANLVGVAALETYREVQRGLGRYTLQSAFYVLANALQLVAVALMALRGWRSPELFLAVYGLSAVAALVLMAPWSRGLGLDLGAIRWRRMTRIGSFMRPVLLQAVFWNVWFNADLILLAHLRGPAQTGTYAAAKAIANGFTLVPTAIAFVFAPRVARMPEAEVRGHLLRVLALTAAVSLPLAIALAASAPLLTGAVFGGRYAAAALPLVVLLAGAVPYGLKSVLGSLWLGLGHPVVETISSAAAMVVTLAAGLWLIPQAGIVGAAAAFSAGAVAQLVVAGAVTAWAFGTGSPRVSHLGDRRILDDEPAAAAAPHTLVVAEELGETPDEGYVSFVRALEARLAARQPTVLHATRRGRAGWTPASQLSRAWQLVAAARLPEVRAARPAAVVYASRSSLTLPALVRARMLRQLCGAPLAFVALQSSSGRPPAGRLLRGLAPDLLLLPTERERAAALAQGVLTATISSGVDLERFRPPLPGERAALRRKWGFSEDDRLVLHVGHLREGRNLRVMASIAALPGVTALVAASSWRGPESERLRRELVEQGVVVLDGYLPNVEELYRLADSYVFPTVASDSAVALPLSVLEALASDLPVVSTAFGALSERFGVVPGLDLVESAELLAERAVAACGTRVRTRHLVEPYGWDAITERLVGQIDDVVLEHSAGGAANVGPLTAAAARMRRAVVDRRGVTRRLLFGSRPGYRARPLSTPPIAAPVEPASPPPAARAGWGGAGIIDLDDTAHPSPVATAAAFLGLPVHFAEHPEAERLLDRAMLERWPLIGLLAGPAPKLPAALAAYVGLGGTIYLDALDERSNEALARLGEALGIGLPEVRRAPPARHLLLAGDRVEFARELAGASLETECGDYAMTPAAADDVLAWGVAAGTRQAAVVQRRAGRGRVVLSVLRRPAGGWPADDLTFERAGSLVVPLLLLREQYGTAAWHAPVVLANATIDDPALRRGLLGMRYDLLAAQAQEHGFHVTIATVPRELALADEAVVERLRRRPDLLSACYHGCDHDAYEFYLTRGGRTRHSPRSLDAQRSALLRAVDHGRRFARQRGCELDRVMVFPYGVGPASLFEDLWRLGFVATCNLGDRYPLEAPTPGDPDLGLRPADLAWGGFPLLWRRGLRDDGYLMDLLLGRPLLLFAHRRPLGRDFAPLAERASTINRMCHGAPVWRSLDEVARHAYLQRFVPGSGWQVLMTANEACLHNPDPEPRTYAVTRPYPPEGAAFEVDGRAGAREEALRVTVPGRSTAVIRVVLGSAIPALRGRQGCTIFEPVARRERLTAASEVSR
jgi:O-antigen/teichoic acid export membrane protein/glycosyltransferase involved in cell wall biosynthesis